MKWTAYPTRGDWRQNRGAEIVGQRIGFAPGGTWAVAPGRRIHLVKSFHGDLYCIGEECPAPAHANLGSQLVEQQT